MDGNNNGFLRSYRPLDAAAYLRTHSWTKTDEIPDRYSIWTKKVAGRGDFEVLLPMSLNASDLGARVREMVDTIRTEERRPTEDVWEDLMSPYFDIVRARLLTNDDGMTLPLDDGAAAFRYSRDLVLAAACSAWQPRAVFGPKKPDQALEVVRSARLGQTKPGSYVIKIITPVFAVTNEVLGEDESFHRRAMTTLASGLGSAIAGAQETASSGQLGDAKAKIKSGISANFCDALAGLGRIGQGVEITFSWAGGIEPPKNVRREFYVPIDAAGHLQALSNWFRQTSTIEDAEFFGSIHRLDKAGDDADELVMAGTLNGERRTVRCRVDGTDRLLAEKAFQERSPVICVGDLSKSGRTYRLVDIRRFQIVEDDDYLFS